MDALLIDRPQNLTRKLALYRRLRSEIETFRAAYPPIFNDDPDLQAIADDLNRRMRDLENQLKEK